MRGPELKALRKILVIKLRYIGDVLITTPFIRALKENIPHASVSALVPAGTEPVLQGNLWLDEIIPYDKNAGLAGNLNVIRKLRDARFDASFDLTDADRSAWLGFFCRAKDRFGFEGGGGLRQRLLYTQAIPPPPPRTHQIDRNLHMLERLGMTIGDRGLSLHLADPELEQARSIIREAGGDPSRHHAVIHAAARTVYKAWPPERFAELGDRLFEAGVQVVLTGAENEREMVQAVRERMKSPAIDLAGRTDLRTLAAVIGNAKVFIGNDSGPMHMASAVGTPVVALFGPTDWESWYPRGKDDIFFSKEVDCRPCGHGIVCDRGEESCMALISLEEVWGAVERRVRREG